MAKNKKNSPKSIRSLRKRSPKYSVSLEFAKINWDKAEKIFTADKEIILKRIERSRSQNPQTREILKLLAAGAIIGLSFVFPTLPMAIAPFIVDSDKYNRKRLNQIVKRLEHQKLVEVISEGEQTIMKITKEGKIRALRYKLDEMKIQKPKVWDKRWRIVIFDIPERYKRMRDIFREKLKLMNFYQLQESVWTHPYPCFDEIEFLRQVYNVGINVTYIVAERIEGSDDLREYFDLG